MNAPTKKSMFAAANAGTPNETFAFEVVSYDVKSPTHSVKGKRIDNGHEVTVFLRDGVTGSAESEYERPSIKAFTAPRKFKNDIGTVAGGVMLAQDAKQISEGLFEARWLNALSHAPGEAEVFIATAHVTELVTSGKTPWSRMTFLHDFDDSRLSEEMKSVLKLTAPFLVENEADLREAVTEAVDAGVGAGVRLSNVESFDSLFASQKKGVSTETAVNEMMKKIPADMLSKIGNEFTAEVVPYGSVFAGPATRDQMKKDKRLQNTLKRYNKEVKFGDTGDRTRNANLYRPTIIALRLSEADSEGKRNVYFTHFQPLMFKREPVDGLLNAISYAQTEHLAPVPERDPVISEAPAPAAPAAEEPSHDEEFSAESFSAGPDSDDDLMGAAAAPALNAAAAAADDEFSSPRTAALAVVAALDGDDLGAPIALPQEDNFSGAPEAQAAVEKKTARAARRFG